MWYTSFAVSDCSGCVGLGPTRFRCTVNGKTAEGDTCQDAKAKIPATVTVTKPPTTKSIVIPTKPSNTTPKDFKASAPKPVFVRSPLPNVSPSTPTPKQTTPNTPAPAPAPTTSSSDSSSSSNDCPSSCSSDLNFQNIICQIQKFGCDKGIPVNLIIPGVGIGVILLVLLLIKR